MLKDRQELFVLGELALFLAAWGLGLAAAVDDHHDRTNAHAENNVAVNSGYSKDDFSEPSLTAPDFTTDPDFTGQWRPGQHRAFE